MSFDGNINLGAPNSSGYNQTPFTLSATALLAPPMLGDCYLPEYALEGSLEPPLALPLLDLNATGYAGNVSDGDITLPLLDLAGGLTTSACCRTTYTLQADAKNGSIADGDLTLPALTLDASLEPLLALPALTLAATAYTGEIGAGAVVLPLLDAAGVMEPQSNLTLPAFTLAATAVAGNVAAGAVTLPKYALDASQFQNNTLTGDCTLLLPLSGTMVSDVTGVGDITLGQFTLPGHRRSGLHLDGRRALAFGPVCRPKSRIR